MKYCNRVFENLYCMPGGNVGLCSWIDVVIGNILEMDIESIWLGETAEKVRNSIKDGSFRYCRKTSCPFCENDTLPELSSEELENKKPTQLPISYNIANDITCNHSCPSCRDDIFIADKEYIDKLKQSLEKLRPYINKAQNISLNGAGEIFSNPLMLKMLEEINPENPNFKLNIETNGALFNRKNWDRIKHLSKYPISVTVTPNSFVRETHAYLSGGHKDYDCVIDNLYFLKELRQKKLLHHFEIAIVVQDRNFNELIPFVKRCINDFQVDQVTVRPLYKWFYISEELYWFKDIMNPYHPYHKEYLEILNDPILSHSKVYLWGARNLHEAKLHPAYKYRDLLKIAKELLTISDVGKKLEKLIKCRGQVNSFIIYGDNDLSRIIYKIMKDTNIKVKCILARDFVKQDEGENDIPFETLMDYSFSDNDLILISNYFDRNFIERDLSLKNFNGQLLDILEAVQEIKLKDIHNGT